MAVVKIPPDGAKKRYMASQENELANKQQMVVRHKNLREKITRGDAMKSLKEHLGWQQIVTWYTGKWSFELIMNSFRNEPEKCKEMMYQREALTMMEKQIQMWIENGDQARKELAEEERSNG